MKNVFKSKTMWAAVIILIINLQQFIPQIQALFPPEYNEIVSSIASLIIVLARFYGSNLDLYVFKKPETKEIDKNENT